jgi:hypothetical protein
MANNLGVDEIPVPKSSFVVRRQGAQNPPSSAILLFLFASREDATEQPGHTA